MTPSELASALGKLSAGVPRRKHKKKFSAEEIAKRTARILAAKKKK